MRPSIPYLGPLKPRFNEKKATQLAAEVLRHAGGSYPYISLVKLIYFIDRAALDRRGFAVSTGTYFCLPYGPIVSEILDLAKDRCSMEEGFWSQHCSVEKVFSFEYHQVVCDHAQVAFSYLGV